MPVLTAIYDIIRAQLATVPPVTTRDLVGKTVVVVGANAGIGYEASKHFAKMNPGRLVLACRNKTKGEEALKKLRKDTDCTAAELRIVDLTSFASVSTFATALNAEVGRLDILVLNVATLPQVTNPRTSDGWETSFQTNHLSPSLLAILLLPKLSETASQHQTIPRLVIVSSEVHFWAKFEQKMIISPNPHRVFGSMAYFNPSDGSFLKESARYNDTKLFNVFFTRALASRSVTHSPSVVIDTVNPGFCNSNLRQFKSYTSWLLNVVAEKTFARTAEQGARQLVWAALESEGGDELAMNGTYISGMSVVDPADSVISQEGKNLQDKLWIDLINELQKVNPDVREIVTQYLK